MNNETDRIDLFVSKDVIPPYSFLFADHFNTQLKIKDTFIYEKEVLIMPINRLGFCTIANNGKIISFGESKTNTFQNIVNSKEKEILRLNGKYFSILHWCTLEYFHFTKNSIQSILTALEQGIDLEEYKILVPKNSPQYVDEYLSLLMECGYKIDFIKVPMDKNISCEEIIFPIPQNRHSKELAHYFRKFRDKVLQRYPIPKDKIIPKIYISRNDAANGRAVYNEDDVVRELNKLGYVKVILSNYSIKEKIQLFSTVKEVVLPHGAGCAHLVYSSPGTKVVEIFMENYCMNFCPDIVHGHGGHYYGMVCKRNIENSLVIDIPLLLEILKKDDMKIYKIPERKYGEEKYINSGNNNPLEIINNALTDMSGNWNSFDGEVSLLLYKKDWDGIVALINKDIKPDSSKSAETLLVFYVSVASMYKKNNDFENQIKMLKKALDIPMSTFDVNVFVDILLTLCNTFHKLKKKEEVLYLIEKYRAVLPLNFYKYPILSYLYYKILYCITFKKHICYKINYRLAKYQI